MHAINIYFWITICLNDNMKLLKIFFNIDQRHVISLSIYWSSRSAESAETQLQLQINERAERFRAHGIVPWHLFYVLQRKD